MFRSVSDGFFDYNQIMKKNSFLNATSLILNFPLRKFLSFFTTRQLLKSTRCKCYVLS